MTSQHAWVQQLRDVFWDMNHRLERLGSTATQNDYPEETRVAWTDFLQEQFEDGDISEYLMDNSLLGPE